MISPVLETRFVSETGNRTFIHLWYPNLIEKNRKNNEQFQIHFKNSLY